MGREVTTGDVFLFAAANRKRAKVLWYDGTGLCLLSKRPDSGRFARLWGDSGEVTLSMSELRLFLEPRTFEAGYIASGHRPSELHRGSASTRQ